MPDDQMPPGGAKTGSPKNIVLFSDGTGNSASSAFKTNVWRTYQALDVEPVGGDTPFQVAFYRDGVGTETFKPLALLGSAFGYGVMKDVRALYVFLCRNYREGDRIYAFGFSRGAFTIRLLVGLVARCGLVQAVDENQLFHFTNAAHRAFHLDFLRRAKRGVIAQIYRLLSKAPRYRGGDENSQIVLACKGLGVAEIPAVRAEIDFLGLWDTVDAYGMPIEEIKQGIDAWFWPMSLADRRLSPIVRRACHALSLDDERPTFRPLLWDEAGDPDPSRIEQRWFAGVHANVGGGYPIDDLAFVALVWMLEKASAAGLRFDPVQVGYFKFMQNVHGTAYDSRSGVAGYYRYGPRSLEKLCHDERNGVTIDRPLIHDSVIERIARRHRAYAPVSLPRDLELTEPDTGRLVRQDRAFVDLTWDTVFWRRIVYFATLGLTAFLVVAPFFLPAAAQPDPCAPCVPSPSVSPLAALLEKALGFFPAWAKPWTAAFEKHPFIAIPLLLALAWLFLVESGRLQRNIGERSEWAWGAMKGNARMKAQEPQLTDRLVRDLRMSPGANRLGKFYDEHFIPNAVGVALVIGLGWCVVWLVNFLLQVMS